MDFDRTRFSNPCRPLAPAPQEADPAPHPIDVHVGACIKALRHRFEISQIALCERIGLTYQQLHKYETAQEAVPASILFELALAFHVGITDFYAGVWPKLAEIWSQEGSERAYFAASPDEVFVLGALREMEPPVRRTVLSKAMKLARRWSAGPT